MRRTDNTDSAWVALADLAVPLIFRLCRGPPSRCCAPQATPCPVLKLGISVPDVQESDNALNWSFENRNRGLLPKGQDCPIPKQKIKKTPLLSSSQIGHCGPNTGESTGFCKRLLGGPLLVGGAGSSPPPPPQSGAEFLEAPKKLFGLK